ncbi:MAG: endonuclease domain-containing protein [Chloroflexi bacterium]|nr:endonuclease domain-containing protein [Chloroflexota bacterium]
MTEIKPPIPAEMLERCRRLRAESTKAESVIWGLLRNSQLMGLRFRRQHTIGGYIVDFYCHKLRFAIELDGGGHAEVGQSEYDIERTKALQKKGIRVLRLWNNDVLSNTEAALEKIWLEATLSGS